MESKHAHLDELLKSHGIDGSRVRNTSLPELCRFPGSCRAEWQRPSAINRRQPIRDTRKCSTSAAGRASFWIAAEPRSPPPSPIAEYLIRHRQQWIVFPSLTGRQVRIARSASPCACCAERAAHLDWVRGWQRRVHGGAQEV